MASDDEDMPIWEKMDSKLDFHENRRMALTNPECAQDKLAEYAQLSISIIQAKDLANQDAGGLAAWFDKNKANPDAYATIVLDDVTTKHRTHRVDDSRAPTWNYQVPEPLPIQSPQSVLRIAVFDYDMDGKSDEKLGWVEIPIADLPLGEVLSGWFALSPKTELIGTAPDRLTQLNRRKWKRGKPWSGYVRLQLKLEVCSGEEDDEWYANCLPTPHFKKYPRAGYVGETEPLDAQEVYDDWQRLHFQLFDRLINSVGGCVTYTCHWVEIPFTCFFVLLLLAGCIFMKYLPAVLFAMPGFFLLCLISSKRRRAMAITPNYAPLNDEGFADVASGDNTDDMVTYLEHVVLAMNGKVVDPAGLHEFAAFCYEAGRPKFSFARLKSELRIAENHDPKFVEFSQEPRQDDSLVEDPETGEVGRIVKCLTPEGTPGTRKYIVDVGPTNSSPLHKEYIGDEIQARLDLRWMSNSAVRAIIPNGVEDMIMGLAPTLTSNAESVRRTVDKLYAIVSWKRCCATLTIVIIFFLISAALAIAASSFWELAFWITFVLQVLFIGLIVGFCIVLACSGAPCCLYFGTRSKANALTRAHADKSQAKWPFFTPDQ